MIADISEYANDIDRAIGQANAETARVIHTTNGRINQNPNLDGNIAEQHHAGTFNIDAAAKGKDFTAVAQESHGKDSVDLFINDDRGSPCAPIPVEVWQRRRDDGAVLRKRRLQ